MATAKSVQSLMKLLDKVPNANKISILLEPENLLKLLQIYGHNKDDIRRKLKSGTIPGELLLELLEREPDADRLLAHLGIDGTTILPPKSATQDKPPEADDFVPPQPEKSTPKAEWQAKPPLASKTKSGSSRNLLGVNLPLAAIVIFTLTAIVPALIVTGFMPIENFSQETGTVIALVGGAVAGIIASPSRRSFWKGMLIGGVYGVSTLWATILYTQARTSILRIEIAIPLVLGMIPAFCVYFVLSKIFPAKANESSTPLE